MINDKQLVDLASAIYDAKSIWWAGPFEENGLYYAVARIGSAKIVTFRGSFTLQDWARDAISEIPTTMPMFAIGQVPLGFAKGMDDSFDKINKLTEDTQEIYATGHSLGASRAGILMLMWAASGRPPRGALFAPARFGMERARSLVFGAHNQACHSYHNMFDPVPDLPSRPPWTNVLDHIHLREQADDDDFGLFSHHHVSLYKRGVYKLFP